MRTIEESRVVLDREAFATVCVWDPSLRSGWQAVGGVGCTWIQGNMAR